MASAEDKITKAKAKLVMQQPFFAHLALGMPFIEAPWLSPPTMATDMKNVYYHPKFVEDHTLAEIIGVIAHEVLHAAWMHGTRRQFRDPLRWNFACDFAINPVVLDSGLTLPEDRLFDEKYRNKSAQEIYTLLEKDQPKIVLKMPNTDPNGQPQDGDGGDQKGKGNGALWGSIMDTKGNDGKAMSESEVAELENEMRIKVTQAAEAAKSIGKLPGGLEGLIKAVAAPKVNWQEYIQNWVSGHTPDNFSWAKPNKKMLVNHRVYMPQIQLNGAGVGVLSLDTSGSVSDNELKAFVNEILGVIEMCSPSKLIIIQHDAVIQKIDEWEAGDEFTGLKIKGRGGTCIQPVFKKLNELEDDVDWMICFTDMGICDYPSAREAPPYPVLWCATGPDNAPFGTYLPLKDAMNG